MQLNRFYCENLDSDVITLSPSESNHLSAARRIGKAQKVELFDGRGTLAVAAVKNITKNKAVLEIEQL